MNYDTNIGDAKKYLRKNWEEGLECPCCGQFVKKYNRKVHSTMALCLIHLYRIHKLSWADTQYHHVRDIVKGISSTGTGDFSKFKYFGLIKEMPKDYKDLKKRTSGFWGITSKGIDFVERRITIPARVQLYNTKVVGFDEQQVDIVEVLGEKFNYQELMKGL